MNGRVPLAGRFMSPVTDYLQTLDTIRRSGSATQERSLYPPLQALLTTIGDTLSPKVRCVHELADVGAGRPDFGLFTATQLSFADIGRDPVATKPERGVIEAKGPAADVAQVAGTRQVHDYWHQYGLVLVTTFRSFLVVARDEAGRMIQRERFDLADSEPAFWALCARPKSLPKDLEIRFAEFLTRVMLHNATLTQPRDVAFFLASYAKDCLWRLESTPRLRAENPMRRFDSLAMLRESLEAALGVRFDTAKGLHFFHSTLVQTLFYGLFSAWVIWYRMPADRQRLPTFSAHGAAWNLKLPVLRALFEQVYRPGALDGLGIANVLDWAADVLRRVDGRAFFARFQEDHAVQYFYEPFLESFDPDLRKQLGVWYTPPEVVDYMVERVDQALRHELGIPLGLADERVHVLDPCCGTGSFILSVLHRIGRTLAAQGDDALMGAEVKRAAMTRVHGFEILPAPFVVAHLQISLLLAHRFGAPLDDAGGHTRNRDEWASIYLTNALTGHDPRYDRQFSLPLPDLQAEVDSANRLKREAPILVVIGNPPYNGFAGVDVSEEERTLTAVYRQVRDVRAPEGQGLNDLYVRFWRMAERRIAEQTGCGIVCLITNYSWLDGLSYTGLRERFLDRFDGIWIDCLNGDKFKTGKKAPDGRPDPSIFSTSQNREGIQVGTAIGLMVRQGDPEPVLERGPGFTRYEEYPPLPVDLERRRARVRFRHFWGPDKLRQLGMLAAAQAPDDIPEYEELAPDPALGLPFLPASANPAYFTWPSLPELMPVSYPGVKTSRDDFLVDIDRDRLEARIRDYFNPDIDDAELGRMYPSVMQETSRFDPKPTRRQLLARGMLPNYILRYCYRPFDVRWIYWEPETRLNGEKSPDLFALQAPGNIFIECREQQTKVDFDRGYVTTVLADNFGSGLSNFFPLFIPNTSKHYSIIGHDGTLYNLSQVAEKAAVELGHSDDRTAIFYHCISVLNAPSYRKYNSSALTRDWPRIPLPASAERLRASAALGRRVADLLDPDRPVPGVTTAPLCPLIQAVGLLRTVEAGLHATEPNSVSPAKAGAHGSSDRRVGGAKEPWTPAFAGEADRRAALDLRVTAGWGHAGQNGVCMPGRGLVRERPWTELERAAIALEARSLGLSEEAALALLGRTCVDVHLNPAACWTAVPAVVWRFTIGGYQVVKKWLSYREHTLLGRPLTEDEARHVRTTIRRLTALVLMGPELDGNYLSVSLHSS